MIYTEEAKKYTEEARKAAEKHIEIAMQHWRTRLVLKIFLIRFYVSICLFFRLFSLIFDLKIYLFCLAQWGSENPPFEIWIHAKVP